LLIEGAEKPHAPYIGTLMRICWQWVREEIYAGLVASGYEHLNRAHVTVFRYPTPDGMRPSQLAERLQITKQSVNDLLRELEDMGYLTREAESTDKRARIVRLTPSGRLLEQAAQREMRMAEERMAAMIGEERFAELRRTVVDLAEALVGREVSKIA
jgi:DNA-binding MarR family transcriptional regulator